MLNFKERFKNFFLEEKSSIVLCLFRPFVALAVAAHVLPTFFHLKDNYWLAGFQTKEPIFFSNLMLAVVDLTPDWFVVVMVIILCYSLILFTLGLFSQASCIVLTVSLYYFYALNPLQLQHFSFDILLSTLFLLCITNTHGDFFSVDAIRHKKSTPPKRPFFVQRLLQLQIAFVFFYIGMGKLVGGGNWLSENPIYFLLNYAPEGIVKAFPLRSALAGDPVWCYRIGLAIVLFQIILPWLLFMRKTRKGAILLGGVFLVGIFFTLHVPTLLVFLIPAQLFLFLDPDALRMRGNPQNLAYNPH